MTELWRMLMRTDSSAKALLRACPEPGKADTSHVCTCLCYCLRLVDDAAVSQLAVSSDYACCFTVGSEFQVMAIA